LPQRNISAQKQQLDTELPAALMPHQLHGRPAPGRPSSCFGP
jgi:hypothetical protein